MASSVDKTRKQSFAGDKTRTVMQNVRGGQRQLRQRDTLGMGLWARGRECDWEKHNEKCGTGTFTVFTVN